MSSQPALTIIPSGEAISFSRIQSYLRCPQKYLLQYIEKIPPSFRPANLAFGSAVHEALASFYRAIMYDYPEPTPGDLVAVYLDSWQRQQDGPAPVLLDDGQDEGELLDQGVALLNTFWKEAERPSEIISVEMRAEVRGRNRGASEPD